MRLPLKQESGEAGIGRRFMKITAILLTILMLAGCSLPVERTYRTAHKSEAEVKADMYDCEKSSGGTGWFTFGPWPFVLAFSAVMLVAGPAVQYEATAQCLEARGYKVREEPQPQGRE